MIIFWSLNVVMCIVFNNLVFNQTQATSKPYDSNISVTCSVTVKPWVINTINPVW